MRRALFSFLVIPLVACSAGPSVTVEGEPFEVTEFSTRLFPGLEGETFVELTFFSDPLPRAIDDEQTIIVTLEIGDLSALELETPVSIGDSLDDPLLGSFQYSCFCGGESTTPALTSGTVTFAKLSAQEIVGELDLQLSGADSNGIEFGEVLIQGRFNAKDAE